MPNETEAWRPGGRIGDFVLRERIGKGSMGVVYRCRHHETGTQFAIKALPLSAGSYLAKRFEKEGQAQAAVDAHPNVLRVRSAGQAAGHMYIVMDLAAGGDLESRLRLGPLPPREGARLIERLAQGLAHVHACGVLHRDLKPANVLFDDDGTPKLVDFGLALHDRESGALTRAGDLIGTPTYMAPEQAKGKHKDVDARADVYGLGAILYHVLTGRRPYEGGTTMEVVSQVIKSDPPRPRSVQPAIPAELEAICVKSMARAPEARYASARELGEALEGFLAQAPTTAAPPAQRPGGQRLAMAVAVGGVALLLSAGLAVTFGPRRSARSLDDEVPTGGAAPARRAEVDTKRLGWTLRVGSLARATIEHRLESKPTEGTEPERQRRTFRSNTQTTWAWEVLRVGPTRASVRATLESLTIDRRSGFGSVRYDSKEDGSSSPFSRALGVAFEFEFDPGTGEVLDVRGVLGLQDAIDKGVSEQNESLRAPLYDVPQFRSRTLMRNFLNQAFFIFPGIQHDDPRSPWERLERIDQAPRSPLRKGRMDMARVMALPRPEEALVRQFQAEGLERGWRVHWKAEGRTRSLSGAARLEDGLLRSSQVDERQTRKRSDGSSRSVEQTLVFKLKGD